MVGLDEPLDGFAEKHLNEISILLVGTRSRQTVEAGYGEETSVAFDWHPCFNQSARSAWAAPAPRSSPHLDLDVVAHGDKELTAIAASAVDSHLIRGSVTGAAGVWSVQAAFIESLLSHTARLHLSIQRRTLC